MHIKAHAYIYRFTLPILSAIKAIKTTQCVRARAV